MIITLTVNPSLDRAVRLSTPLTVGGVHRIVDDHTDPGGKGVNVARVCDEAGVPTTAILPAQQDDKLLKLLNDCDLHVVTTPTGGAVRTNLTVVDSDSETTKINESGYPLSNDDCEAIISTVIDQVRLASEGCDDKVWVVIAGSLPAGVPADFYADLVVRLRAFNVKIAVDTSDAPLVEMARRFPEAAPDVIKPNSFEITQIVGGDGQYLEDQAIAGNRQPIVHAARKLIDKGVTHVLATMGEGGAALVSADEAWGGSCPARDVRSTVGAGDASLAGYVLASHKGLSMTERLRWAVCYGSAAVEKEGTKPPQPEDLQLDKATVERL